VITAYDTRQTALDAIRSGAYEYFAKPFNLKEVEIIVKRTLERRSLRAEVRRLRKRLIGMATERLVGRSQAIQQVKEMVERIAPLEATVLITGESGTGKELVADLIHRLSFRASGPLIKVNCAAIPESLLESELFGHEKGHSRGPMRRDPGIRIGLSWNDPPRRDRGDAPRASGQAPPCSGTQRSGSFGRTKACGGGYPDPGLH